MTQSINDALVIAHNCARAKRIAGHLADVPYSQAQLCEVIATMLEQFNILEEATTLANRRYAATNAQLAKLKKKHGEEQGE